MKKQRPFKTEVDLCAAFINEIPDGWTSYAETANWDILLVRAADGFQIGVQAKLKLNALVMAQAVESDYRATSAGPDCRAILVPAGETSIGLGFLCQFVGVTIIYMRAAAAPGGWRTGKLFDPQLPRLGEEWSERHWFEQAPTKRHQLPDYIPDVKAGDKSPLQLTKWKIGALKIAVLLEINGHVTREDFKTVGIDHRRWVPSGWLTVCGGRYEATQHTPNFKAQHPTVFEQIKADMPKWRKEAGGTLL